MAHTKCFCRQEIRRKYHTQEERSVMVSFKCQGKTGQTFIRTNSEGENFQGEEEHLALGIRKRHVDKASFSSLCL